MFMLMTRLDGLSRRSFLAAAAAAAATPFALAQAKKVPVGIELYSVRNELTKDTLGTVKAIAKMGYAVVEFYAPYYQWTTDFARDVRKLMDDNGIRCNSTHNGGQSFSEAGIGKAIELNQIIGSKYVVMASAPGNPKTLDQWKGVADTLTKAMD